MMVKIVEWGNGGSAPGRSLSARESGVVYHLRVGVLAKTERHKEMKG